MDKTSEDIRIIAGKAAKVFPASEDHTFACVREAYVAGPVLVRSPNDEPAFWLVPYVQGDLACGFARIGLSGTVSQVAVFGAGTNDRHSWIDASFFKNPPNDLLAEITRNYPDLAVSKTLLSYDRTPVKWAWRVELTAEAEVQVVIFITPGGWHESKQGADEDANMNSE